MSRRLDRRDFLKLLTAGGLSAASACGGKSSEEVLSHLRYLEETAPGTATYYATTCRECPAGCGLLVKTISGRVMKLEGNPDHPLSRGGLCARGQAAVQGLYNPDRINQPLFRGKDGKLRVVSWEKAFQMLGRALGGPLVRGQTGAVGWITGETTDSDTDLLTEFCRQAGWNAPLNLRLVPEASLTRAVRGLFRYEGVPEYRFDQATLLVSIGADFMESWGSPVSQLAGFTSIHAYREGIKGRVIYIGPRRSNTAAACDEWVPLAPGREAGALRILIDGVLSRIGKTDTRELRTIKRLVETIPLAGAQRASGKAALSLQQLGWDLVDSQGPLVIVSGTGPDAELAQLLALLSVYLAGGMGRTLTFPDPPRPQRGHGTGEVLDLIRAAGAGEVETLLIHEANPAFLLPGAAEALDSARFIACFTNQFDETAARADLILPVHHSLESWGYQRASAELTGLLQPAMRPLFGSKSLGEMLLGILPALPESTADRFPLRSPETLLLAELERLHRTAGSDQSVDQFATEAKKRAFVSTPAKQSRVRLNSNASFPTWPEPEEEVVACFFPHPYIHDGRGADKPWLQEVPETSTSAVWGAWVELHPKTAVQMGIARGDGISLGRKGAQIDLPVLITEQVVPGTAAVPIGQGHEELGRWAAGIGANPLKLASLSENGENLVLAGLSLDYRPRPGEGKSLILTSGSQQQGNRKLALAVKPEEIQRGENDHNHQATLYADHTHPDHQWAMVIDLDACVGCGACVTACYAENNVAAVGPKLVREGREMSWIRIEKYVDGEEVRLILNLCQHCHHAPCETVCPVHAPYHTPEGLNAQVYNRCVGTRYCANNCPYKVRRFNWRDYPIEEPLNLQLNPDVTVRERGVMEKCTFCVQRIRAAKENAKNEERPLRDGEVTPACAQSCPTRAITFGDLNDPHSRVSELQNDPRGYRLLSELGTRPSVLYLKKVIRT